jgi:exopolysaccharide production protein ExoQ
MNSSADGASMKAAGYSPATSSYAPQGSLLRFTAPLDVIMLFTWVFSTVLLFGWSQPLRYIAAAYFLGALVLFARQTLPTTLRAWPTLIIPLFCIVSALWAPSAPDAIRKGMLFALGSIVSIYAASRVSGRNILLVFMAVETIAAIMSALKPTIIGGAWTGIFGQKNFLAINMFILYIAALGIMLDKSANRWFRFWALGVAPLAFFIMLMTKSATTTVMLIGATGAMLGHAFLWRPAARIQHLRLLIVLGATVALLVAMLMLFGFMNFDAGNSVLSALGKDSTLTGRTYLWATAERTMAEHPMLGVGADGFWRSEYGLANSITRYFDYETYVKFSFHNSYLENGVAFGYPGYWATVFIAAWAIWRPGVTWLKNQTAINAAFLILAIMVIIRTTTEIDLALEFTATCTLLFAGAARVDKPPLGARQP